MFLTSSSVYLQFTHIEIFFCSPFKSREKIIPSSIRFVLDVAIRRRGAEHEYANANVLRCQNGSDLYSDFPCYDKYLLQSVPTCNNASLMPSACHFGCRQFESACVAHFYIHISSSAHLDKNQTRMKEKVFSAWPKGSAFVLCIQFYCVIAYSASR